MTSTFCRHNRFLENCPICSKKARTHPGTVEGAAAADSAARRTSPAEARHSASAAARAPERKRPARSASNLVVRRVERAVDDGYEHDLVPGLRASEDARRLAAELVWSAARLEELASAPSGLYGEVAALDDKEEAMWWLFLIAFLAPTEGAEDPFAAIRAAHVPWGAAELPVFDAAAAGPRSALSGPQGRTTSRMGLASAGGKAIAAPAPEAVGESTVKAYRAWAERSGGQVTGLAGDEAWDASRRFDRAYERLALPRFGREPRYELVTLAGAFGLIDAEPASLQLLEPMSPVATASKRIFAIGDPVLLARRAGELAAAAEVPLGAFDLALQSWNRGERITAGSGLAEDPQPDRRSAVEAALGV